MTFRKDFVWGAAAASYQVEGAALEDGKGLSVWDMMCRKEGAIWKGQNGDAACDHYHRYEEDVALMKEIGLQGYRMSISWPRVLPEGIGKVNEKGLSFYDRLIDELLAKGVDPYVTLFHWDYPYELYCRGGWLNSKSSDWFAEYARVIVDKLSDRVKNWITLNEPQCFIGGGHQSGVHAPGDKLGVKEVLLAAHNALLAHGKAVQVIRSRSKSECRIGYAPVGVVKIPATQSQADIDAARQSMFSMPDGDVWNNTWWMDPVFFGRYPEDGLKAYGDAAPTVGASDMEIISQPVDFFGANIYHGRETRFDENGKPEDSPKDLGYGLTMMQWPVTPEALYWGPKFFYEHYKKPIMITENGVANTDWVALDGKVHDPQRIDYLQRYLLALRKASEEGTEITGYFHWTTTDNFEWSHGFSKRFGLIFTDFNTQKRTLKDSAYWYRDVIASNGESLDEGIEN